MCVSRSICRLFIRVIRGEPWSVIVAFRLWTGQIPLVLLGQGICGNVNTRTVIYNHQQSVSPWFTFPPSNYFTDHSDRLQVIVLIMIGMWEYSESGLCICSWTDSSRWDCISGMNVDIPRIFFLYYSLIYFYAFGNSALPPSERVMEYFLS